MNITVSEYTIEMNVPSPVTAAVVADLHDKPVCMPVIKILRSLLPDFILIPGDLFEDFDKEEYALTFLENVASFSDIFYSIGNHDRLSEKARKKVKDSGTVLLDNSYSFCAGLYICGLTSGVIAGRHHKERTPPPDLDSLCEFASLDGPKLLLCHHPEYYREYIKDRTIDVTVSGHAHGGHWRIFGQGLYAPGQGIFPKYTSGLYDGGRLVVSRGLGDHSLIPRLFNRHEIILLHIVPNNDINKEK